MSVTDASLEEQEEKQQEKEERHWTSVQPLSLGYAAEIFRNFKACSIA